MGYRKLKEALQGHFKFRPGQLEALLPVVHVFVRMPTGGRKSLRMFLVPLAVNKKAIGVVSPLVSLMDQQVSKLYAAGG